MLNLQFLKRTIMGFPSSKYDDVGFRNIRGVVGTGLPNSAAWSLFIITTKLPSPLVRQKNLLPVVATNSDYFPAKVGECPDICGNSLCHIVT